MSDSQHTSKTPALSRGMLTEAEVFTLMQAFTLGKTEILEEDAIALIRWAENMRLGAILVNMMLAGKVCPVVQDGIVCAFRHRSRH